MKFCKKCEKQTPTAIVKGEEECMVCGSKLSESKLETTKKPIIDLKSKPTPKPKDIADVYAKSKIESKTQKYESSGSSYSGGGGASSILGGIMIMIIGFSALTIGNYIITAITKSLPTVSGSLNDQMTNTTSGIMNYVITVIPLFGLAMMVLGFAVILFTLRSGMGSGEYGDY